MPTVVGVGSDTLEGRSMANKCWCGKCKPERNGNGSIKHYVMNWKLYQLRTDNGK